MAAGRSSPVRVLARRREPSAFEAVTRAQLEALRAEVAEIKTRVNGLLWTMVAAVALEVVKALMG